MILTLAVMGLLGVAFFSGVLAWWWHSAVFKGSSRVFLAMLLVGVAMGYTLVLSLSLDQALGTWLGERGRCGLKCADHLLSTDSAFWAMQV